MKLFRIYYQRITIDNKGNQQTYNAYTDIWAKSKSNAEYKYIMSGEWEESIVIKTIIQIN